MMLLLVMPVLVMPVLVQLLVRQRVLAHPRLNAPVLVLSHQCISRRQLEQPQVSPGLQVLRPRHGCTPQPSRFWFAMAGTSTLQMPRASLPSCLRVGDMHVLPSPPSCLPSVPARTARCDCGCRVRCDGMTKLTCAVTWPQTPMGVTAAHGAAFQGRKDILKLLLAAGADLHAEDRQGNTPVEVHQPHRALPHV